MPRTTAPAPGKCPSSPDKRPSWVREKAERTCAAGDHRFGAGLGPEATGDSEAQIAASVAAAAVAVKKAAAEAEKKEAAEKKAAAEAEKKVAAEKKAAALYGPPGSGSQFAGEGEDEEIVVQAEQPVVDATTEMSSDDEEEDGVQVILQDHSQPKGKKLPFKFRPKSSIRRKKKKKNEDESQDESEDEPPEDESGCAEPEPEETAEPEPEETAAEPEPEETDMVIHWNAPWVVHWESAIGPKFWAAYGGAHAAVKWLQTTVPQQVDAMAKALVGATPIKSKSEFKGQVKVYRNGQLAWKYGPKTGTGLEALAEHLVEQHSLGGKAAEKVETFVRPSGRDLPTQCLAEVY